MQQDDPIPHGDRLARSAPLSRLAVGHPEGVALTAQEHEGLTVRHSGGGSRGVWMPRSPRTLVSSPPYSAESLLKERVKQELKAKNGLQVYDLYKFFGGGRV